MKRIFLLLIFAGIFSHLKSQEPPNAFEMNERLGRGINMGNAFEAPTETAWGNPWQPYYFQTMSELGFSHVRIPVRWSTPERSMDVPPYTIYQSFLERIQEVVDTALKYQLHPIINMHHHDDLFEDPLGQKDRFLAQWSQIADYFQDYPDSLVFEVLNEPHDNLTPELWNEFFAQALDSIRVTNPTRTVLMGTALFGGLSGVPYLEIPDDPYVILSVHYYNPFQFTHQGASWVGDHADAWLGTKWFDTEVERQTIIDEFAFLQQFAAANNVAVHVGEFGAYSTADLDSRVRWTNFVARWFEEQNYSWAYWEFSAGFGIYNPSNGQFITPLVDALLHNPMPDPVPVTLIPLLEDNFEQGPDGWQLNAFAPAQASMTASQGYLTIDISNTGTENWHIQLFKQGIPLKKGNLYKVTFDAIAEGDPRSIVSYIGKSTDPWTAYSSYQDIYVDTLESTYSYAFFMNNDDDNNSRKVFDLGLSQTNISFSRIMVERMEIATFVNDPTLENIILYPNPVRNIFSLKNAESFHTITIFDINGKKLSSYPISGNEAGFDISHFTPGIYLIHLKSKYNSFAIKLIKE